MPIIGGHVSAAGGVSNAVERGLNIKASVIMFFGASPRQFAVKIPADDEIELFKKKFAKSKLKAAFMHAPYLINLGSEKPRSRGFSQVLLAKHLEIANRLGINGLIFHTGSAKDGDRNEAIDFAIQGLKNVLAKDKGKTLLILENASGGGKIGTLPSDAARIFKGVKSKRLKVCIDTAHSFESGLLDYTPKGIKKFFDDWEKAAGKGSVVCLHANDSKTPFDSKADRHENIGQGYIGIDGFKNLSKDPRVAKIPWILEVPGYDNEGPDKKNVEILRKAVKGE